MRYKGLKITLILLTIILLICLSPFFNVKTVYVENNNRVNQDTILNVTILNTYNKNIFLYPTGKYKKELLLNPYMGDVTITKNLPNTITVSVNERELVAYIMYAEKTYLFIDENGIVLDSKQSITEQLPIITGLTFDRFSIGSPIEVENPESLRVAEELATTISRYNNDDREIVIDTRDVDNITLNIGNINVIFGSINDADEKVRLMLASIDAVPDENIKGFLYVNDITQSPRLKIIT